MASLTDHLDSVGPMDAELRMIRTAFDHIQEFNSAIELSAMLGGAFWLPDTADGQPERQIAALTEYQLARDILISDLLRALHELDPEYFEPDPENVELAIDLDNLMDHIEHFVRGIVETLEVKILSRKGKKVDEERLHVAYRYAEDLFAGAITAQIKARELEEVSDLGKVLSVEERLAQRREMRLRCIEKEERAEEEQRMRLEAAEARRRNKAKLPWSKKSARNTAR